METRVQQEQQQHVTGGICVALGSLSPEGTTACFAQLDGRTSGWSWSHQGPSSWREGPPQLPWRPKLSLWDTSTGAKHGL